MIWYFAIWMMKMKLFLWWAVRSPRYARFIFFYSRQIILLIISWIFPVEISNWWRMMNECMHAPPADSLEGIPKAPLHVYATKRKTILHRGQAKTLVRAHNLLKCSSPIYIIHLNEHWWPFLITLRRPQFVLHEIARWKTTKIEKKHTAEQPKTPDFNLKCTQ